jgi:hypothetical protein
MNVHIILVAALEQELGFGSDSRIHMAGLCEASA